MRVSPRRTRGQGPVVWAIAAGVGVICRHLGERWWSSGQVSAPLTCTTVPLLLAIATAVALGGVPRPSASELLRGARAPGFQVNASRIAITAMVVAAAAEMYAGAGVAVRWFLLVTWTVNLSIWLLRA